MVTVKLYVYQRGDGGITVSPRELVGDEYKDYRLTDAEGYRLIADEGKMLTNGEYITPCIDVESTEGWYEIDAPIEETN